MTDSENLADEPLAICSRIEDQTESPGEIAFLAAVPTLLCHNLPGGNLHLLMDRDRMLLSGEKAFFVADRSDGSVVWRERARKTITVRHGIGNIYFEDGKDRTILEGDENALALVNIGGAEGVDGMWKEADSEMPKDELFYDLRFHKIHQTAMARIAVAVANLEYQACQLFIWMMQTPPPHGAAAYYALRNNDSRIKMMQELLPWLHTDGERMVVKHLLSECREAASIRSKYLHSPWRLKDGEVLIVENLRTHYPHGTSRRITPQLISDDAAKLELGLKVVASTTDALTRLRPLRVDSGALKPTFVRKFRAQSRRRDP